MNTTHTKPEQPDAEFYQIQSARNAVARAIARMIERPSKEVMAAKVKADAALSEYRDIIRDEARKVMARI